MKCDPPPSYEESRYSFSAQTQDRNYYCYTLAQGQPAAIHTDMSSGPPPPPPPPPPPATNLDYAGAYSRGALWENRSIRDAFIRKVYLIVSSQLLLTASIVAVFTFAEPVRLFVIQNPLVYWMSYVVFFILYLVLVCCRNVRRQYPMNLILLFLFTLALSYMTGTISSYYETKAVFLAVVITALVCLAITGFSFQSKVDFTSLTGFLCILGVLLFIAGIITSIVFSFEYIKWLHVVYAAFGAIVFSLFLILNTQLLLGNRAHSLSPEEHVYGALCIYTSIIQIFLFMLQITGSSYH